MARVAALEQPEVAKTRLAVIVSLDVLNQRLQSVTICPLTTQLHPAWRTRLGALSSDQGRALRRLITEMYRE